MRVGSVLALLACMAGSPAAAAEHQWRDYANVRYAYQLCYPADLMRPQPEAPNGDGRVFVGAHGARLSVWGEAADGTLTSDMVSSVALLTKGGGEITYKVVRPDWYVLSARRGDTILYYRTRLASGVLKTFELDYPAAEATTWNPVVARVGTCFRSLDGPHYGRPH
ncbi:MAG: hypothetical protein ACRYFW_10925 [Janthinobacterium lividum]